MSEAKDFTAQRSDTSDSAMIPSPEASPTAEENVRASEYRSVELSGPIPSPAVLGQYERLVPGTAERLIKMAEKEQNHRHEMDMKVASAQINDLRRNRLENNLGQVFGLVIGLTAIMAGSFTAIKGSQLAGGLIGTAGVAGLVSAFVLGKDGKPLRSESEE
jgi:uncharacterized membrane protein